MSVATLAQARARLRRMLRELTANQWSDGALNELIDDSNTEIIAKMALVRNSGWDQLQETVTLPANASAFALATGTNPTALTKYADGIINIEHQGVSGFWNQCNELQEGDEYRYRAINAIVATGDIPPLYLLRRQNIIFLPIATADRTLRITYRPAATPLFNPAAAIDSTALDTTPLDVPDKRIPLVCTRAAIMALAQIGQQETQFDGAYVKLEDEMYAELNHPQREGATVGVKLIDTPALFSF